ncbi:MAG: electron transfer flavoprotein subunit beta/FixA family protein [Desulfuromonadales bacterium]|nr:electron transfer flavoprotein subunit beta/FixA family protein [Desulfuromonadales bacterium]
MKIVVLIKSVPDTASLLQLTVDNKSILTDQLEYIMNPYDEFALEEAVLLKKSVGGEIITVSLGDKQSVKCIRQSLAVGADTSIWIRTSASIHLTAYKVAKIMAPVIRELAPDVIFAGKQAIDDDAAQVPERIAELLDMPHVSSITSFSLKDRNVMVDRQVEGGQYRMETTLPAMFTTEKGLNVPRYPKLMDILNAKKKQIREIIMDDMGDQDCSLKPGLETILMVLQKQKRAAMIIAGEPSEQVGKLVPLLRTEGIL